jgi:hypothetical protein
MVLCTVCTYYIFQGSPSLHLALKAGVDGHPAVLPINLSPCSLSDSPRGRLVHSFQPLLIFRAGVEGGSANISRLFWFQLRLYPRSMPFSLLLRRCPDPPADLLALQPMLVFVGIIPRLKILRLAPARGTLWIFRRSFTRSEQPGTDRQML